MGFYGNISNTTRAGFVFDRIYASRAEMEAALSGKLSAQQDWEKETLGDGVYVGRYVLIDYDRETILYQQKITTPDGSVIPLPGDKQPGMLLGMRVFKDSSKSNILYMDATFKNPIYLGNDLVTSNGILYNVQKGTLCYVKTDDDTYEIFEATGEVVATEVVADQGAAEFRPIKNSNYGKNYNNDADWAKRNGADLGRGWDGTVWQKNFINGKEEYVLVAELNSVVPSFDLSTDAPSVTPIAPHFDQASSNVYYKLHLQPNWGIRIKPSKVQIGTRLTDGNDGECKDPEQPNALCRYSDIHEEYPSDFTMTLQRDYFKAGENAPTRQYFQEFEEVTQNGVTGTWSEKPEDADAKVGAAIYVNKEGFNPEIIHRGAEAWPDGDMITLTPTGKSGTNYNRHYISPDDQDQRLVSAQEDMQELVMMLPSIGDAIADMWDVIYGDETYGIEQPDGTHRNTDVAWEDASIEPKRKGLRLVHELKDGNGFDQEGEVIKDIDENGDIQYSYSVDQVNTVAGCINSVHDLMGMIIDDQQQPFTVEEPVYNRETKEITAGGTILNADMDKIYYIKDLGEYQRKKEEYYPIILEEEDYVYERADIQPNEITFNKHYYYLLQDEKYIPCENYIEGEEYYIRYPKIDTYQEVTVIEELTDESKYYIISRYNKDENPDYLLATELKEDRDYYSLTEIEEVQLAESYAPSMYYYPVYPNDNETLMPDYILDENSVPGENKSYGTIEEISSISGTYYRPGYYYYYLPLKDENGHIKEEGLVDEDGNPVYENGEWVKVPILSGTIARDYEPVPTKNRQYYEVIDSGLEVQDPTHLQEAIQLDSDTFEALRTIYFYEKVVTGAKVVQIYRMNEDTGKYDLPDEKYFNEDNEPRSLIVVQCGPSDVYDPTITYFTTIGSPTSDPEHYTEKMPSPYAQYIPIDNMIYYNVNEGYYYKDGNDYILSKDIIGDNSKEYFKIEFNQEDSFYVPKFYWYKSGKNYLVATDTEMDEEKAPFYRITAENLGTIYEYEDGKFYQKGDVDFVLDNDGFDEGERYYLKNNQYYVYEDALKVLNPFSQWNLSNGVVATEINNNYLVPSTLKLCLLSKFYSMETLEGFSRKLNTIHGLILKINQLLEMNDVKTRESNVLSGAENQLKDIIARFNEPIVPGRILIGDDYGRVHGASYTTKQDIVYTNIGANEQTNMGSKDNAFIRLETNGDIEKPSITLLHTYNPIEDTKTTLDKNTDDSNTLDLYTPIVDNMGHVVGKNTQTVTLPSSFKTITSENDSGDNAWPPKDIVSEDVVASGVVGSFGINTANSWIAIESKDNTLTFGHKTLSINETDKDPTDLNENQVNTITIQDFTTDIAGHVLTNQKHEYTLPYGFKTIKTNGVGTNVDKTTEILSEAEIVADHTQDVLTINSNDKWIRINADSDADTITIGHEIHELSSGTDTQILGSQNKAAVTFDIPTYSFDEAGHYTGVITKTLTMPSNYGTITTNKNDDTKGTTATATSDILTLAGDNWVNIAVTTDLVTFTHNAAQTASQNTETRTDVTLNFGDSFSIDDLSFDAKGHLSVINKHSITLPTISIKGNVIASAEGNRPSVLLTSINQPTSGNLNEITYTYSTLGNMALTSNGDILSQIIEDINTGISNNETAINTIRNANLGSRATDESEGSGIYGELDQLWNNIDEIRNDSITPINNRLLEVESLVGTPATEASGEEEDEDYVPATEASGLFKEIEEIKASEITAETEFDYSNDNSEETKFTIQTLLEYISTLEDRIYALEHPEPETPEPTPEPEGPDEPEPEIPDPEDPESGEEPPEVNPDEQEEETEETP